jgi:hypothetical protein
MPFVTREGNFPTVLTCTAVQRGAFREALRLLNPQSMTCRYCGLHTDGGDSHRNITECLDALASETKRLRDMLRRSWPEDRPMRVQRPMWGDVGRRNRGPRES